MLDPPPPLELKPTHTYEAEIHFENMQVIQSRIEKLFVPTFKGEEDPEIKFIVDAFHEFTNVITRAKIHIATLQSIAAKSPRKSATGKRKKEVQAKKKRRPSVKPLSEMSDFMIGFSDEDDGLALLDGTEKAQIHGEQRVKDSAFFQDRGKQSRKSSLQGSRTTSKVPEYAREVSRREIMERVKRSHTYKEDPDAIHPDDSISNQSEETSTEDFEDAKDGEDSEINSDDPEDDSDPDDGGDPGGPGGPGGPGDPDDPGDPRRPAGRGRRAGRRPKKKAESGNAEITKLLAGLTNAMVLGLNQGYNVLEHFGTKFSGDEKNVANAYLQWAEAWAVQHRKLKSLGKTDSQIFRPGFGPRDYNSFW
jgi:hypothetical protein